MRSLSRRRFLKKTFVGVVALSAARLLGPAMLFAQRRSAPHQALRFFDEEEYQIINAAAARLVGPPLRNEQGAAAIDVALRADRFLSTADPEIQSQFHLLLTILNSTLTAILFDFRFANFLDMSPSAQDDYLEGWMTSRLAFRRTAFQGLKRLCMSMYYTDERSWHEIGYQPVTLPEEFQ